MIEPHRESISRGSNIRFINFFTQTRWPGARFATQLTPSKCNTRASACPAIVIRMRVPDNNQPTQGYSTPNTPFAFFLAAPWESARGAKAETVMRSAIAAGIVAKAKVAM